jgi:ssDNA-binding Zn-finger/Zn-ribbon topoisomerase 1
MEMIQCTKCGGNMPLLRLSKYGYKSCVNCSTTPKVGGVAITNHKTGNAIQIVPMDLAIRITKASQRQGYGVCKGMKSSF